MPPSLFSTVSEGGGDPGKKNRVPAAPEDRKEKEKKGENYD
jgi:hypothetical protein